MKSTLSFLFILCFSFVFIGCKTNSKKKDTPDTTIQTDTISEPINQEYEPTDDEIQEYGIIEEIEDGAYPFFSITMNFVERNMKYSFSVNIESISLTDKELYNLKGKYATIYYTSDLVNDLSDLYFEEKSLSGEYAPEMDTSWKKITGILNGAGSLSGDLPSKISVTDANGKKMNFELYVDDEVQKVNKKEVTAYYTLRGVTTVMHIKASED